MEPDIKYLNEERVKLWARIEDIQTAVAQQQSDSKTAMEQLIGKLDGDISGLKTSILVVEKLAREKLTENGEVALQAAKDAVEKKDEIQKVADDVKTIQEKIVEATKQLESIQQYAFKSKEYTESIQKVVDNLASVKKSVDAEMVEFAQRIEKSKQSAADTTASCSTAGQQKQLVLELADKVASEVSSIKANKERSDVLISGLEELNARMTEELRSKSETLAVLTSDNSGSLKKLYDENAKSLKQLNEEYKDEIKKRTKEIDDMIPGAMTAGLATAFANRRDTQNHARWLWGILLIIATALIVLFGIAQSLGFRVPAGDAVGASLGKILQSAHSMTWYSRAIILAGLVFFEEFARKNFNIASRLEESYAYKAVVFSTYYGYKKDLKETLSQDENNSVTTLVNTVLEKLKDEPGKNVFDKEKQEIGAGAIMDRIVPVGGDTPAQKALEDIAKGTPFSKISWQVVALALVVGVSIISLAIVAAHIYGGRL